MTRITKVTLITFLLGLTFVGLALNELQKSQNQKDSTQANVLESESTETNFYPVTKVVDGDTFKIQDQTTEKTIRLIGLDTPETVHPTKPVECFGKEASNAAKQKLSNQKVKLLRDPTQSDTDKYGRLLRYVYLQDGTLFNQWMIKEGYGFEYTYNLPYQFQAEFKEAETQAQEEKKGLWKDGACDEYQTKTISLTPQHHLLP